MDKYIEIIRAVVDSLPSDLRWEISNESGREFSATYGNCNIYVGRDPPKTKQIGVSPIDMGSVYLAIEHLPQTTGGFTLLVPDVRIHSKQLRRKKAGREAINSLERLHGNAVRSCLAVILQQQ